MAYGNRHRQIEPNRRHGFASDLGVGHARGFDATDGVDRDTVGRAPRQGRRPEIGAGDGNNLATGFNGRGSDSSNRRGLIRYYLYATTTTFNNLAYASQP